MAEQIVAALGIALALGWIAYILISIWNEKERKRREYLQAVLEFRWRDDISPIEFEQCCADYLGLKGWNAATTGRSGDQGADVVARKASHLLVVQCKKYSRPVGNKAVQEVIAARTRQHFCVRGVHHFARTGQLLVAPG